MKALVLIDKRIRGPGMLEKVGPLDLWKVGAHMPTGCLEMGVDGACCEIVVGESYAFLCVEE